MSATRLAGALAMMIIVASLSVGSVSAAKATTVSGAQPTHVSRSASVTDCITMIYRIGRSWATDSPWTAVRAATSVAGCGDSAATAICRGTYFWGPFGAPFRAVVGFVTRGRYHNC